MVYASSLSLSARQIRLLLMGKLIARNYILHKLITEEDSCTLHNRDLESYWNMIQSHQYYITKS